MVWSKMLYEEHTTEKWEVCVALAGVGQWIECHSINEKVAGSIPSQGKCLGCRPGPRLGMCKKQLNK